MQPDFLWDVVAAMLFLMQVIVWIKQCVTPTHYSISIIVVLEGYVGEKGLRQGEKLAGQQVRCPGSMG